MNLTRHLLDRHCNLDFHRPYIDDQEGVATFALWNLSGQMVGYQQYRPSASKKKKNSPKEGRYFTYRPGPTLAVFGVESLCLTPGLLFLTEGVFDACRLTERGFSAVAALSNNPQGQLRAWLKTVGGRVVVVRDSDPAGALLAKFGDEVLTTGSKDLGDSTDTEVDLLLSRF